MNDDSRNWGFGFDPEQRRYVVIGAPPPAAGGYILIAESVLLAVYRRPRRLHAAAMRWLMGIRTLTRDEARKLTGLDL